MKAASEFDHNVTLEFDAGDCNQWQILQDHPKPGEPFSARFDSLIGLPIVAERIALQLSV